MRLPDYLILNLERSTRNVSSWMIKPDSNEFSSFLGCVLFFANVILRETLACPFFWWHTQNCKRSAKMRRHNKGAAKRRRKNIRRHAQHKEHRANQMCDDKARAHQTCELRTADYTSNTSKTKCRCGQSCITLKTY